MVAKETTKAVSREEVKKAKKSNKNQDKSSQKQKVSFRIRLLPIWLRVVLVLLLMAVSTIAGLVVGYGVIGNGNPGDAIDQSTWQHIVDLVEKE